VLVATAVAAMTRAEDDVLALEADMIREEIHRELWCLAPLLAMFFSLLLVPSYRDKRGCVAANVVAVGACIAFSRWVLARTEGAAVLPYAVLNSIVKHAARSFVHLVWLWNHNDDTFTRLILLFIAPVGSAHQSRQGSFKVYMAVHFALTLFRFRDEPLETAAPWVVAVLVQIHVLFDISALKQRSEERTFELYSVQKNTCALAIEAVRNIVTCFCDASAELSADLTLLGDSPTLSTLLGRQATKDKAFEDFIHFGDKDEYRKFAGELTPQMVQAREEDPEEQNPKRTKRRMQVRSMLLHLVDSYSVPLRANVFHAYIEDPKGEPVLIVGINEAWKPPEVKSKNRPRSTSRSRGASLGQVDVGTGRLQPTSPLYPKGDEHLLTAEVGARRASLGAGGPRRRRGDSPRPAETRALTPRACAGRLAGSNAGGAGPAADAAQALTRARAALTHAVSLVPTPQGMAFAPKPPAVETGPAN